MANALRNQVIIWFATITTNFMIVDQKLASKQFFQLYISTIWILNRKPDSPLKAISPDVLKFRYLASRATQESDNSHVDKVCISQFLKRFNLLHE